LDEGRCPIRSTFTVAVLGPMEKPTGNLLEGVSGVCYRLGTWSAQEC